MKYLPLVIAIALALGVAAAALAQDEVPPEYEGLTNPFDWEDDAARASGSEAYGRMCLGCHGASGGSIRSADFSTADFPQLIEERADYYFWITSEGRMSAGMPPFKGSVSEDERWQILTYMRSLGGAAAPAPTPIVGAVPAVLGGAIKLTTATEADVGEPFAVSAILMDQSFEPLPNATVKFYYHTEFYGEGWAEIGRAFTNKDGEASAKVMIGVSGEFQIAARYPNVESVQTISVAPSDHPLYTPHAGLHLPNFTDDVTLGPQSAYELGENSGAPISYFRWPGGMRGILLFAYVGAIALVWGLYIRSMYNLFRISPQGGQLDQPDTRLVPFLGLIIMSGFVALLVIVVITGPQSHFHLVH